MNEVDAVKTGAEVDVIERQLRKWNGNLYADLFRFGIQVALRIGDLRSLRYDQFDMVNRQFTVIETKTGKARTIRLNDRAMEIINRRRAQHPDDVYLFQGQANRNRKDPVSRQSVGRVFKAVGDKHGIRLGTHSLRKTRGWVMHSAGVPIETICKVLNHSHPSVTMRYLGITQSEVMQTYDDFVI